MFAFTMLFPYWSVVLMKKHISSINKVWHLKFFNCVFKNFFKLLFLSIEYLQTMWFFFFLFNHSLFGKVTWHPCDSSRTICGPRRRCWILTTDKSSRPGPLTQRLTTSAFHSAFLRCMCRRRKGAATRGAGGVNELGHASCVVMVTRAAFVGSWFAGHPRDPCLENWPVSQWPHECCVQDSGDTQERRAAGTTQPTLPATSSAGFEFNHS